MKAGSCARSSRRPAPRRESASTRESETSAFLLPFLQFCNSAILQFCNFQYSVPVPRNAEVIRQWTILREIERARGAGVTIDDLASLCSVTTRTIRRDLKALEESGFP